MYRAKGAMQKTGIVESWWIGFEWFYTTTYEGSRAMRNKSVFIMSWYPCPLQAYKHFHPFLCLLNTIYFFYRKGNGKKRKEQAAAFQRVANLKQKPTGP
jgi:hypothetical protein